MTCQDMAQPRHHEVLATEGKGFRHFGGLERPNMTTPGQNNGFLTQSRGLFLTAQMGEAAGAENGTLGAGLRSINKPRERERAGTPWRVYSSRATRLFS